MVHSAVASTLGWLFSECAACRIQQPHVPARSIADEVADRSCSAKKRLPSLALCRTRIFCIVCIPPRLLYPVPISELSNHSETGFAHAPEHSGTDEQTLCRLS